MQRSFAVRVARCIALAGGLIALATGVADASVLVNKAFSPSSIQIGNNSTVTITLSNTSVINPATITSFSDDISTMGGIAQIAATPNLSTTCTGGTPSISGSVVSLNNGVIPVAPNTMTPGTCTISFTVTGEIVGNGINTIAAGALVTNQGSNATSAQQTLQVQSVNVTITPSATNYNLSTVTATQTLTITNPTSVTLTNAGAAISAGNDGGSDYVSFSGGSTNCGGSVVFGPFPTLNTGMITVTGMTIPAGGSCVITVHASDPSVSTQAVALTYINVGGITDTQGVTNGIAAGGTSVFYTGYMTGAVTYAPSTINAGNTSRLSIHLTNTQPTAIANLSVTDNLPAGVTLDPVPAESDDTHCGSPVIGGAGTSTLTISNAALGASAMLGSNGLTCIVTVTVDTTVSTATTTNTIPAANITDTQNISLGAGNSISGTLTISPSQVGSAIAFQGNPEIRGTPFTLTYTFSNFGSTALTNGSFTNTLPQTPAPLTYYPAYTPTFSGCGASPSVSASGGNTIVNGSGLTIAANGTCTVTIEVVFGPAAIGSLDTDTLPTSSVSFTNSSSVVINPATASTAYVKNAAAFGLSNLVAAVSGVANQPIAAQAQIVFNSVAGVTDTNALATFELNFSGSHNLALASPPNFTFSGCPTGANAPVATGAGGAESFTVAVPSIGATCTINFNLVNEATVTGASAAYPTGISTYTSNENVSTSPYTGVYGAFFYNTSLLINTTFAPTTISSGGTSVATIKLDVNGVAALTQTQANGVAFSDTLPANTSFAPMPNVTIGPSCQQTGQPTPSSVIAGSTISFSNISLLANGTTSVDCNISFSVTSTVLGNATNTIAASAVTSTSGATNAAGTSASLTVVAGVAVQTSFLTSTFAIGGTDYARILIVNSGASALGSGTLTDTLPSSLVLASLTAQPAAQGGDPPSCGGTTTGTVGSSTFGLTGMSVAAATNSTTPGECVEYVQVQAATSAAPGTLVNTIAAGALEIGGQSNLTAAASPTLTLSAAPNVTLTAALSPSTIIQGTAETETLTFANTASGAAPLTNLALSVNALAGGFDVASVPNASTTCASGTITAVAGASSFSIAGASLAAGASCTLTVNLVAPAAGSFTDAIAAGAVTTTQGATNALVSNGITVAAAPNLTVASVFAPTTIGLNGTSVFTVNIVNGTSGAVSLTNLALTNTLPSGVVLAASPAGSTTCSNVNGTGVVTATAGATSFSLAGGALLANASCTISVTVTSASAGTYTDTIAANAFTSAQGATNILTSSSPLVVAASPVVLTKSFTPASIQPTTTATLSITLANTGSNAIALSGLALADALPTGVTFAATPNAATTCVSGSASVAGTTLSLAGATLAAGASCTLSASVTSSMPNTYTDTTAVSAVTTTQGVTNAATAAATLTVTGANTYVDTSFTPSYTTSNVPAVFTASINNNLTGAINLTGVGLGIALPSGMTIAPTPNPTTTCTGATAAWNGTTFILAGGSLAAGASCTMSLNVVSSTAGIYAPSVPMGSVTTTQGVTNGPGASQVLSVYPPIVASATMLPTSITTGATSTYTLTLANTGTGSGAAAALGFTQTLPAGLVVAAIPAATNTCGGTFAPTAAATSLTLGAGTLAAGASCSLSVALTSASANSYTATFPAGALTSTHNITNTAAASAMLTVVTPSPVTVTKAFAPSSVGAGSASVYTITIANTGANAIALSGLSLSDTFSAPLSFTATPNAATTCPGGTATASGTTLALSGATLAAGASCTFSANLTSTTVASTTDTTPASAVATTQGVTNAASASATLTGTGGPLNITLSYTGYITTGISDALSINFFNNSGGAVNLSNLTLNDALPTGLVFTATPNPATTCTGGTAGTSGTTLTLSGATLAAGASCSVTANITGNTPGSYVFSFPNGSISTAQGVVIIAPPGATLIVSPPVAVTPSFVPNAIVYSQVSTYTITFANTGIGANAITNMSLVGSHALPSGLVVAPTPNASTSCGAGVLNAPAGATTIGLSGASLAAGATCTLSVAVTPTSAAANVYTDTIAPSAVHTSTGITNTATTNATLTVGIASTVTLSFPASVQTTLSLSVPLVLTIANTGSNAIALSGLGVAVTLPGAAAFTATPNAATTCPSGTASIAGQTLTLSGGTLAAGASCTLSANVTNAGAAMNTVSVPASAVTSTQSVSNAVGASWTFVTSPPVTITPTFSPATIPATQTSSYTVTIANAAAGATALSALQLAAALPTGVTFAATPNATTTCPSGSATTSGATLSLTGAALTAGSSCTFSATVTSSSAASYTATIPALAVSSTQNVTNLASANAMLTVNTPSSLAVTPTFAPTSMLPGATTTLTISIANTGSSAIPLTALALSNTLPTGLTIATTPNAATTCTSGSASASAGGTTLALSGATLAAGASCALSVSVTGSVANTYTDTVAASAITTTQGVSNAAAGNAMLTINPASAVTLTFPATAHTTNTLALPFTVTLANTGGSAIALTNVGLPLTLPASATFYVPPNAATTCASGSVAIAGQTLTLSGASLAVGAMCTVSVNVTAPAAATSTVTVAAGAIISTQGVTNAAGGSWTLITAPPVTVSAAYAPASIPSGQTSTYTVSIANTGSGAVALSGMQLSSALPTNVTFATTPNAATTCPSGSASTSGATLSLTNGTLAAGASCAFSATVTASATGSDTNLIATLAVATTQNVTNLAPTSATLSVNTPSPLAVTSAFSPASIVATTTSPLTITIANTGTSAIALGGLAFTQTLPAGLTLASSPSAATTCASGTLSATGGGTTFSLVNATLAVGATCGVTVAVTGSNLGSFTATTAASAITTTQGITNTAPTSATLQIIAAAPIALTAAFTPASIAVGQTSTLTLTLANSASGAVALSSVGLGVTLPTGITVASTPNGATTCPSGAVTGPPGASSMSLANGALSASATCTLTMNITAAANGTSTLTIPANDVTSLQHASNASMAQATLTVSSPTLAVSVGSNITGTAVSAGQPITYTISVANTGAAAETNATIVATLGNATLLAGSVRVNGTAAPDGVLAGTTPFGAIAAGTTTMIVFTANVPTTIANGATITNHVTTSGDQPCIGATCSANATALSVQPPQLTATLTVDGKTSETVVLDQIVTFTATVTNVGGSTAEAVTFTDTLPNGITPIPGTITTGTLTRHTLATNTSGQTITADLGALGPNGTTTVSFQARIAAAIVGEATNTVTIGALGLATAVSSNVVIVQSVKSVIIVTKTASVSVATAGDRVDFRVQISGPPAIALGATTIVDMLPGGMLYAPGTARVNGTLLAPTVAGRTLTWTLPALTAPLTLTYATAIGAGMAPNTTLTNTVGVTAVSPGGGAAATGSGSASVAIIASSFGTCYPITGRVYVDVNHTGRFTHGDRGVAGVRIDLDDGEAVVTDAQGRYNFPCARQGMHALRLDEQSLPNGIVPFADRNIDSERSTQRLVHRTFDDTIVEDVNFAVDAR